jgi:replicative DNA helicase
VIENSVVKFLLKKENYTSVRDSIDIMDFAKEVQPIIRTIDSYYLSVDNPEDLSVDSLSNLYFSTNRSKIDFYTQVFEALRNTDASDYSTTRLISSLKRTRLLREVSIASYEASEGRGDYQNLLTKLEDLKTPEEDLDVTSEDDDFVSSDLVEIVNTSRDMEGLGFRLGSLNKALGPLRKGEFGFVFARPETGKTTFLASEITHMAGQASQPILWLNNEEVGTQVMLRCYQAALGLDLTQLMSDLEGNRKRYLEVTKDNIRLKDAASIHYKQVEKLCEKLKPSLIVFDQIDKLKGFDNDREDLRLGAIYIWARELAKRYAPVIGVCQADGSGEGQRWLTMANVANAKTSKQAEADWILGVGKITDPGYDNLRFLHLSKNKLPGGPEADPSMRHGRWEVLIDPMRARYMDL